MGRATAVQITHTGGYTELLGGSADVVPRFTAVLGCVDTFLIICHIIRLNVWRQLGRQLFQIIFERRLPVDLFKQQVFVRRQRGQHACCKLCY